MSEESLADRHRTLVERVRNAESFVVTLPVVGSVRLPRPEQLAYYGALAALAAAEIIDWPVALALAAGHALIEDQHSRVAQEIGEALEQV
jgi:hypothetical protein